MSRSLSGYLALGLTILISGCGGTQGTTSLPVAPQAAAVHTATIATATNTTTSTACTTSPVKDLQVTATAITLNGTGATQTFTACTQYFSDYTITASNPGVVSFPATVTPTEPTTIYSAQITVAALVDNNKTTTLTITDKKGHSASVTITVVPVTTTLSYTGAAQPFTVPAGVTQLTITALGANGNSNFTGGTTPGLGASVTATVPVAVPGETLQVYVGGNGFNGGGGGNNNDDGGGASDVREGGVDLTNRIVVAGGGGSTGGIAGIVSLPGGNGGQLSLPTCVPTAPCIGAGSNGTSSSSLYPDLGGFGGGTTTGGAAGIAPAVIGGILSSGTAGSLGQGGFGFLAGNGGGGYYGGGGGSQLMVANLVDGTTSSYYGSGGGGSSYVESGATATGLNPDSSSNGNGQVTITY